MVDASVARLWAEYRRRNPRAPAEMPPAFHFCDNAEDADLCAELVRTGRKRATASSAAELELAGDPRPRAGDYAIVTNWAGEAVAVIRTSSIETRKFSEVDAAFAREEGEGDLTLGWWRRAHKAYYSRVLAGSGHKVDGDLEILCERFDLVMTA